MLQFFLYYLYKSGPIFLFFALALGVIGLPIPDELLLTGAGYLMAHNKINSFATIFFAFLGACSGITISYLLGRLVNKWVIKKFGAQLNLTAEKIHTVEMWFERIGKWILIIGFYIPLFRHLVGFIAGGSKLPFKNFALFAYAGALIWSLTFLAIGYFFPHWFITLFNK